MILHHQMLQVIKAFFMSMLDIWMEHVEVGFYFIQIQFRLADNVYLSSKLDNILIWSILAYAIACASLSIAGSSLSIILLWLAGGYLYIRRRRLAPGFVTIIALLTFFICKSFLFIYFSEIYFLVWTTAVVWIVMLTMNRDGNLKISRENIGFSLWIAVGASGGYLLAFLAFLLYRFNLKRQKFYQGGDNSRRF